MNKTVFYDAANRSVTNQDVDAEIDTMVTRLHYRNPYPYRDGCRCDFCRGVASRIGIKIPGWNRAKIREHLVTIRENDMLDDEMKRIRESA